MNSPQSQRHLSKVWLTYIIYSSILFLTILSYQILRMDIIADDLQFLENLVPKLIKQTSHILGIEDYSELKTIQLAIKLLPNVIHFSLGMYARRKMLRSAIKEQKLRDNINISKTSWVSQNIEFSKSLDEIVFDSEITFSYISFKCK